MQPLQSSKTLHLSLWIWSLVSAMPSIAECSRKGIHSPSSQLHYIIHIFIVPRFTVHSIYLCCHYPGCFLIPLEIPSTLEFLVTRSLRISIAILSITLHQSNTSFASHLFYVSVSVSVSISGSASMTMYCILVDLSVMITFIYKSIIPTVQPHSELLATLVDGKMMLLYSSYISLSYFIAGVSYHSTFFVVLFEAQLIILGIPYLK